ncbi:MAG: penicillin-binding protein 2 [Anaerolineales bacterium]|nr:penicillin-binding protein 2 [Anaerolineales bacterium]
MTTYLAAWQAGDYAAMYALLTAESQAAWSAADFEQQYRRELEKITVTQIQTEIIGVEESGDSAQAIIKLKYLTRLVGNLETELNATLRRESGQWRLVFSPTLIWPELVNGQQLLMVTVSPRRGAIYDRNGIPLVQLSEAYTVGLVPSELTEDSGAISGVARLLGLPAEVVRRQVEAALQAGVGAQYLALGEVTITDTQRFGYLFNTPGVQFNAYTDRYYAGNGAAAHVTGYTSFIQPDELETFQARGYMGSERVGRTGLEAWGEPYLAGRPGAQLQLRDANLNFLRMVARTASTPAQDIYTTIDFNLQQAAQAALSGFTGGIVVMDYATGEVLALASSPTFSPNIFSNNRHAFLVNSVFNNPQRPLLNHATQATYPAGSVFKIVTMAAALTSGRFTPETRYTCTGTWNETTDPNFIRRDWFEQGHGELTLMQGLTASCNPWFYHIGFDLHNWNPQWLPDMARAFGLGQPTNIGQIEEIPGLIPDATWKQRTRGEAWNAIDSINLSIGQGDVLVTPLQIARMAAAVANGGTLLQPQLVREIRPAEGPPTFTFQPLVSGTLPLSAEQLAAIQEAMKNVPREPIGTARLVFRGFRIPVAGKTGTAEDPGLFGVNEPDAWFAGYTYANRPDKPDIAIAVVVANAGQGSDFAAPIFRRVVEAYFGLPYRKFDWEETIGVPRLPTPTPEPGATPAETETPTPTP